jgi:hypothetical protein
MRRLVIAPILGPVALGLVIVAVAAAGPTAPGTATISTPPAPTGQAPLSEAALIHRWLLQPNTAGGEVPGVVARLRAVASGATPRSTPGATPAGPLAADVFNHDTAGLPQNEESVTVCRRTVLGGTNDFRGLLLGPPPTPAAGAGRPLAPAPGAGWHVSTDKGRTLRNEGLLPPVTIAGQPVPVHGDPVDVAGQGCSLYASGVGSTPDDRLSAVVAYRSRPGTLTSCGGGTDAACWPTRRAVATAGLPHFLDKEWMAVGPSGRAGEVVWGVVHRLPPRRRRQRTQLHHQGRPLPPDADRLHRPHPGVRW